MAQISKIPDWFREWQESGFIRIESAEQWRMHGFDAKGAAPWYHLDSVTPAEARTWVTALLGPGDYVRWKSIGCTSPSDVGQWRHVRVDFNIALEWHKVGVSDPNIAKRCIDVGISPGNWKSCKESAGSRRCEEWLRFSEVAKWLTSAVRSEWMDNGVSPVVARSWINLSVDLKTSEYLESQGFVALDFQLIESEIELKALVGFALQCESKEHFSYLIEHFDESERMSLIQSEVEFNQLLQWEGDSDLSADELIQLARFGLTRSDVDSWKSIEGTSLEQLFVLLGTGLSPRESVEWTRRGLVLHEVEIIHKFMTHETFDLLFDFGMKKEDLIFQLKRETSQEELLYFVASINQIDAMFECSKIGIKENEIMAWWHLSGGVTSLIKTWRENDVTLKEIDDVQRLSMRRIQLMDSKVWASNGYTIKEGLKFLANGHSPYWKRKPSAAKPVPIPPKRIQSNRDVDRTSINFPKLRLMSGGDLNEFQSRAVYVAHRITKSPPVGMEFIDVERGIRVRLEDVSDVVLVTVHLGQNSFVVKFDSVNFDSLVSLKTAELKTAYVLAVSWFIDCAITLKAPKQSSSSNFEVQKTRQESRSKQHVRYVPTLKFRDSIRQVRAGNGVSPVTHQVSGHIRQLPDGRSPREESVKRAPKFLREKMSDQDTFVIGHTRGSEKEIDEFITRLSRYSLMAHAFVSSFENV